MLRIRSLSFMFFSILICLSSTARGQQPWSGILTTSRAGANWPSAGATIPTGTIPNCATQPSGNTPAAISAAFAADAGGSSYCQINIPAGTYNVSGTINLSYAGKANVVLNGAGANQTFFVWTGTGFTNCNGLAPTALCIWNGDSSTNGGNCCNFANSSQISSGYSQGSTTLNLSNVSNLKVGSQIQIAQADPGSDNGNAFFCESSGFNGSCGQTGSSSSPFLNGTSFSQTQLVTVASCGASSFGASCTNNAVTITPAIFAPNWASGQNPTAWWSNTMPLYNVGVQNLSLDVSGITQNGILTEMHDNANTWMLNVRQINSDVQNVAARNHVLVWQSSHVTIANSYFYGANPNANGYGIDWSAGTSDSLAYNNITQHMPSGLMMETSIGNVFAYNYDVDNYFGSNWQQCDEFHHQAGDYYNLFEGNVGVCITEDDLHGTMFANTFYRNRLSGYDPATEGGARESNTMAVQIAAYARYSNLVANVLGTSGYHKTYMNGASSTTSCGSGNVAMIYMFGYSDQNGAEFSASCIGAPFSINNDLSVASSTMLWGNYDTVNGSVQENSSETASNAPVYPGLASPATTFPASFYLSAQPTWWAFPNGSAAPWPAIGPDITGGNISGVGGHAWLNPAANCYLNNMGGSTNGSSGPLAFNPSACYPTTASSSSGPAAPFNLTGTVVQ